MGNFFEGFKRVPSKRFSSDRAGVRLEWVAPENQEDIKSLITISKVELNIEIIPGSFYIRVPQQDADALHACALLDGFVRFQPFLPQIYPVFTLNNTCVYFTLGELWAALLNAKIIPKSECPV